MIPNKYTNWTYNWTDEDKAQVTSTKITSDAILAVESYGDRKTGENIKGAFTDKLDKQRALRLCIPQTEDEVRSSTATASDNRYLLYDFIFDTDSIVSKGTVPSPVSSTVYDKDTNSYNVTLTCEDENANIYYSTENAGVQKEYSSGASINIPKTDKAQYIYIKAVRNGYEDGGVKRVKLSAGPYYSIENTDSSYAMGKETTFKLYLNDADSSLIAAAQANIAVDKNTWTLSDVNSYGGFESGTSSNSERDLIKFGYLGFSNLEESIAQIGNSKILIGEIKLTPKVSGSQGLTLKDTAVYDEGGKDVSADNISNNVNVLASYKLTFNPASGSLATSLRTRQVIVGDKYNKYAKLPAPTRTGYTFLGWFKSDGKQIKDTDTVNLTGNTTVAAKWKGNTYTVKFHVNSGKAIKTKSKKVVMGSKYSTLPKGTKGSAYSFVGWYTKPSGGTKVTSSTKVSRAAPHTLYAQYSKRYRIKFSANRGYVKTKSKLVARRLTYGTLPSTWRKGYGFLGWYTGKSSGRKITKTTVVSSTRSHTLYARWGKKYKLYYNANGGKVSPTSKIIVNGSTVGSLPKPTRSGYIFKGWYTAKSGGTKIGSTSKVRISKNITIYAQWYK